MSNPAPSTFDAGHAWSKIPRREPPTRPPSERLTDFLEIDGVYDEAAARAQASRCVQCPEPTCVVGCPLRLHIPEWLSLTAEGEFAEASRLLQATGTMPEICARVCPAEMLCEGMCLLDVRTEPVAIRAVEQFLNAYAEAHGLVTPTVAPPNGWRVAVIGAGAGGLACAHELTKRGFAVTVFDEHAAADDQLAHGTPAFRLERTVVQRRIVLLQKQGVIFRVGVTVGRDVSRGELESMFDCIYLDIGARKPRTLDIPGIHLDHVVQATTLREQQNNAAPGQTRFPAIDLRDKHVLVIGGGDTAVDCLRTALRCGARDAIGIYRRDEASMPCCRREYESAVEEGVGFLFQAVPVAVMGNEQGEVTGLQLVRTALGPPDADRRRAFSLQPGTRFELETDWIFLAIGSDLEPLAPPNPFHDLFADKSGRVSVDANQRTVHNRIFAGGDLVRGPCMTVQAVRDARRAAAGIERYLLTR